MASCCVTKAALEKKGHSFPDLSNVDSVDLFRMASFNFRKCHALFQEITKTQSRLCCQTVLDLERRWFNALERLRATEEKIDAIRAGKISADQLLNRARVFSPKRVPAKMRVINHKPLGEKKTSSFPILRATATELVNRTGMGIDSLLNGTAIPGLPVPTDKPFPGKDLAEMIRGKKEPVEREMTDEEMKSLCEVWENFTGKKAPIELVRRPEKPAEKKKKKKKR